MPGGAGPQLLVLAVTLVVAAGLLLLVRGRRRRPAARPAPAPAGERRPVVAVVVNPTKVGGRDPRRERVERQVLALGWDPPQWLPTTVEDPGTGQTRAALAAGADAVIAYGGDGTVRSVAGPLCHSGVPLGLLPAGTGNLLARNLGIGLNGGSSGLDRAVGTALGGDTRAVDVARAEIDVSGEDQRPRRETFLVMAGLGFDAQVMAAVHDQPRLKRVGWPAYVVAGIRIMRGRQTRVALHLDDAPPISRRVRTVIVGNCGELAGGAQLMPAAQLDDGRLDVVVVTPRGVAGWAAVTAMVLTRSRFGHSLVEHFQCRRVEVHAERPLPMQLDGDPIGEARTLRAEVDPGALLVRVP
jgi:diacylglycerol kinase (ATP)